MFGVGRKIDERHQGDREECQRQHQARDERHVPSPAPDRCGGGVGWRVDRRLGGSRRHLAGDLDARIEKAACQVDQEVHRDDERDDQHDGRLHHDDLACRDVGQDHATKARQ